MGTLGTGDARGDDTTGIAAGGSQQAAHGGQIHVARARRAPPASQVEQEALDVLVRDRGRGLADVREEATGAVGEGVGGIRP
jgi:hypothetical protein